jgi:hypothetical protein
MSLPVSKPLLIGVSGYARSGKDTVGRILVESHGFKRRAFADKLKELALALDVHVATSVASYGWEEAKNDSYVREYLQRLGASARDIVAEDIWVTALLKGLTQSANHVVTDVRFVNEANAIRGLGGFIWRINRPGINAVNNHISEHQMSAYNFDAAIDNDGSLEDLEVKIKTELQIFRL